MAKIFAEHNFFLIFEAIGMYFVDHIRARNGDYLLYSNSYEFYFTTLVKEFYDGFSVDNIDHDHEVIKVNRSGEIKIVNIQTISDLTSILIIESENQNLGNLWDYMFLMGYHCKSSEGGGISAKTVYHNVYALGRWLDQNVLGVSHVSSFYNQALHIVHMKMTRDRHFCMCQTLLDTIASAKDRC